MFIRSLKMAWWMKNTLGRCTSMVRMGFLLHRLPRWNTLDMAATPTHRLLLYHEHWSLSSTIFSSLFLLVILLSFACVFTGADSILCRVSFCSVPAISTPFPLLPHFLFFFFLAPFSRQWMEDVSALDPSTLSVLCSFQEISSTDLIRSVVSFSIRYFSLCSIWLRSGKRSEICWAIGCRITYSLQISFSSVLLSYLLHNCLCSLFFLSLLMRLWVLFALKQITNSLCFPSSS